MYKRQRLLLVGQNTNKIPFSKEAPFVQDDDQEIMSSHLLQGILPDMTDKISPCHLVQTLTFLRSVMEQTALLRGSAT